MAKVALVNDIHIGVRSDSQIFGDFQSKFYREVFFPYIDKHDIKYFAALGDILDRRTFVNYQSAKRLEESIVRPLHDRGIESWWIVGNHDMPLKNSCEINSMKQLYGNHKYDTMNIVDTPTDIEVDGTKLLLLPWICSGNYADCFKAMKKTKANILLAHLEISGFEMYKGSVVDIGMDYKEFQKFEMVLSGHFHHRSHRANIWYLGTQYEQTWADFSDVKGFHILDTDTRELEFIKNPFTIFHKIVYDDTSTNSLKALLAFVREDDVKDKYVKLVVRNKTNPFWFDSVFDKLEKCNPVNVQVQDESMNFALDFDTASEQVEDTLQILHRYLEEMDLDTNKDDLENLLKSLYHDAQNLVEQA